MEAARTYATEGRSPPGNGPHTYSTAVRAPAPRARPQPSLLTSRTAPLSALVAIAAYAFSAADTLRSRFLGA